MSGVQLALRKDDKRIGARFIQFWTGSKYSHCELVYAGNCYSSSVMDKGVRCKGVGKGPDQIDLNPDKWDVIDIPLADGIGIVDYFTRTDDNTYGWMALITSQFFNRNISDNRSQFCSEWCAAALGLPNASAYSPGSLAAHCTYMLDFVRA